MKPQLPAALYRAEQVRSMDAAIIDSGSISGSELMERAGQAAFDFIREHWPEVRKMSIVCGGGNNGGDGYVIARLAHLAGYDVQCLYIKPPTELGGDAGTAAEKAIEAGLTPVSYEIPSNTDLVVDAILGTGLDRPVEGRLETIIEELNAVDAGKIAVDIPSGLNADTGAIMGIAFRADATCSFIGLKQGMFTADGPECSGHVYFHDLNTPDLLPEDLRPDASLIQPDLIYEHLPPRKRGAHKGHFGHVLLVGGAKGFTGAIRMAAEAAGRVGAGLVSVATDPAHASLISLPRPEIMSHGTARAAELAPLVSRCNVIAIGPGLGQSSWAQQLMSNVLETDLPKVLDADALNLLAQEPTHHDQWVLTPHPGEAARLLQSSPAEIQSDRFAAVGEIQKRYGGVIVLKGSGSLIANGDGQVWVSDTGNPGMASGGMGDVLTGVIAGLIAQGLTQTQAACLGVYVHGLAGDAAALDGERGMLATDLLPELRRLVNP